MRTRPITGDGKDCDNLQPGRRLIFPVTVSLLVHLAAGFLYSALFMQTQHIFMPAPQTLSLPTLSVALLPENTLQPKAAAHTTVDIRSLLPLKNFAANNDWRAENAGSLLRLPDEDISTTSNAQSSGSVGSTYFGATELSLRAQIVKDIPKTLPELENFPGQGKVTLILFINERGEVDRIEIESSDISETLAWKVASTFDAALFHPGQIDGQPVKSRMRIEVRINPL